MPDLSLIFSEVWEISQGRPMHSNGKCDWSLLAADGEFMTAGEVLTPLLLRATLISSVTPSRSVHDT